MHKGARAFYFYLLVLEREKGREENINLLAHLSLHSVVAACMCPDRGSNPQPWCIRMMLNQLSYPARASKHIHFFTKKKEVRHISVPVILVFV